MGKISRFLGNAAKDAAKAIAKDVFVERSFTCGQDGVSPPQYADPYLQEVSDEAYRQGQLSVAVKVGNRIAGEK